MTPKNYFSSIVVSLGIYALLVYSLALMSFTNETELAIIFSIILPLYLLVKYLNNAASAFDFRVVYLGSIFVWSFGKSFSIFMNYGYLNISGQFLGTYLLCIAIAPTLILLFKTSYSGSHLCIAVPNRCTVIFMIIVWLFLSYFLYWSLNAPADNPTAFIIKQVCQGLMLVFAASLVMLLFRRGTFSSIILLITVAGITLFVFLQGPLNRTSLVLPLLILTLSALSQSKFIRVGLKSTKIYLALIFSLPFFLILLHMADLQKQSSLSLLDTLDLMAANPAFIIDTIKNSNYFPDKDSASFYFNSINSILESSNEIPGGLLYQLVSSSMPRIFFPGKAVTDLSQLMWENGIFLQPLYYEIFLEPIIDFRVLGVLFYYSLFLFFVWQSWACMMIFKGAFRSIYCRSTYILNLVVLFMIIRGPVIFLVWYALLPNMVLWWWIFLRQLRKCFIRSPAVSN